MMRILYIGSPRSAAEINKRISDQVCDGGKWDGDGEAEEWAKLYEGCPVACSSVEMIRQGHDMRRGTRARIWSWPKMTETSR